MIPIIEQKLTKEDCQRIKEEKNKIDIWIPVVIILGTVLILWLIIEAVYIMAGFLFLFCGIVLSLLISGLRKINIDTLKDVKLVGQVKVTYKLSSGTKDTTYHIDCFIILPKNWTTN
jgi:hypothetical protein